MLLKMTKGKSIKKTFSFLFLFFSFFFCLKVRTCVLELCSHHIDMQNVQAFDFYENFGIFLIYLFILNVRQVTVAVWCSGKIISKVQTCCMFNSWERWCFNKIWACAYLLLGKWETLFLYSLFTLHLFHCSFNWGKNADYRWDRTREW